jgi:CubicO group peptidase (beta-lactamase class C family)
MASSAISKFEKIFSRPRFTGSVLIVKEGRVLFRKGYGMADYEKKIPNTLLTNFRLGSITKQFTAMCILILEEKGLLNVNDPISKYICDYPNGDKITIHNLLTHTSGIATYYYRYSDDVNHYYSPRDLISLFKDKPALFQPGEKFEYNNSNYILLGYIIEKVSGLKYKEFLQQYIFTPLDMNNSGYEDGKTIFQNKATGYQLFWFHLVKADNPDMSIYYSGAGLRSTVEDLYKWDQALYTEKLVKKKTLKKMFAIYYREVIPYSYGWYIERFGCMFHGGYVDGFSSFIYRDTWKHLVIIILSNEEDKDLKVYLDRITDIFSTRRKR